MNINAYFFLQIHRTLKLHTFFVENDGELQEHAKELSYVVDEHMKEIKLVTQSHVDQLEELKQVHTDEVEQLKQAHANEAMELNNAFKRLQETSDQEKQKLQSEFQKQIEELNMTITKVSSELQNQVNMDKLKAEFDEQHHQQQILQQNIKDEETTKKLQEEFSQQLQTVEKTHAMEIQQFGVQVEQIQEKHQHELQNLQITHEQEKERLLGDIEVLASKLVEQQVRADKAEVEKEELSTQGLHQQKQFEEARQSILKLQQENAELSEIQLGQFTQEKQQLLGDIEILKSKLVEQQEQMDNSEGHIAGKLEEGNKRNETQLQSEFRVEDTMHSGRPSKGDLNKSFFSFKL